MAGSLEFGVSTNWEKGVACLGTLKRSRLTLVMGRKLRHNLIFVHNKGTSQQLQLV